MWDKLEPYFQGTGAFLLLVGFVMLLVAAFRYRALWGLATLFVLPAPLFVLLHFRKAWAGFLVMVLGVALVVTPVAVNHVVHFDVNLGALERQVDNELHITLTGWKPTDMDYSVLLARPHTVVLQMANEDVTDGTLEYLKGMKNLRDLDLSNTQVTDEGLKVLAALSSLRILHLNNTKITDQGVRASIYPLEGLTELNVRKTQVTKKTRDEWKAAKEGRKVTPAF